MNLPNNPVINLLMLRDGLSLDEALQEFNITSDAISKALTYRQAASILDTYLSLEEDYLEFFGYMDFLE